MRDLRCSVLALSVIWSVGALTFVQAAGVSIGDTHSQRNNPWGAPGYYGQTYPRNPGYAYPHDRPTPAQNTWEMPHPTRMMNMMPNPMGMLNGRRNDPTNYPVLPPQRAYTYPPAPRRTQQSYPSADRYSQQAPAYRSPAPQRPSTSPAPRQDSYAASQQQWSSQLGTSRQGRSGMGMGQQPRQQPRYNSSQGFSQLDESRPQYQSPSYRYPSQQQSQPASGSLIDRGGYPAPPSAMQPPSMNAMSGERPLVNRGDYPAPPPVPNMPSMQQEQYTQRPYSFNQAPQYAAPTPRPAPSQHTHTQRYDNTPRYNDRPRPISPQAGSPYSIPPVSPGLDLYPEYESLQPPPPPPEY